MPLYIGGEWWGLECTGVRGLVEWIARGREEEGVGLCLAAERKAREQAKEHDLLYMVWGGVGWCGVGWG